MQELQKKRLRDGAYFKIFQKKFLLNLTSAYLQVKNL